MRSAFEAGGKAIACTPCFTKRGYKEEDLRDGFTLAGAAYVVEVIASGSDTLCF